MRYSWLRILDGLAIVLLLFVIGSQVWGTIASDFARLPAVVFSIVCALCCVGIYLNITGTKIITGYLLAIFGTGCAIAAPRFGMHFPDSAFLWSPFVLIGMGLVIVPRAFYNGFAKGIQRDLLIAVFLVLLAVVADKAFYLYSRSRYSTIVRLWDSMTDVFPSGSFSQSDIRYVFGAPDTLKGYDWIYRCQDFSQSRYGFPFCEILLTGSADHFMVYEVYFRFHESGEIAKFGTRWHTGSLFKRAKTLD